MSDTAEGMPTLEIVEGPSTSDRLSQQFMKLAGNIAESDMAPRRDRVSLDTSGLEFEVNGGNLHNIAYLAESRSNIEIAMTGWMLHDEAEFCQPNLVFDGKLMISEGTPSAHLEISDIFRGDFTSWEDAVLEHFGGNEGVYLLEPESKEGSGKTGKIRLLKQMPSGGWVYFEFLEEAIPETKSGSYDADITPVRVNKGDDGTITLDRVEMKEGYYYAMGIVTDVLLASQEAMTVMNKVWHKDIGKEGLPQVLDL